MSDKPLGVNETPVWIKPLTSGPAEVCGSVRDDLRRCQQLVEEATRVINQTLPTLIGQCSQADAAVLSEIIRAMQFSDMVQQLLESSDGALSRVVDFLAQARRTAPRQTEHRCCEDRMGSWTDQLSAFKTATCTLVPGPVEQENLSSGDIELF